MHRTEVLGRGGSEMKRIKIKSKSAGKGRVNRPYKSADPYRRSFASRTVAQLRVDSCVAPVMGYGFGRHRLIPENTGPTMTDPRHFVIRRPRHAAHDNDKSRVWLEYSSSEFGELPEAQLVDFSRKGAKFALSGRVVPDESILVRIQDDANSLDITLPAVVRWQRAEGNGEWALGCLFEQEVPYEIVDELFLSGVLSTDAE